MKRPRGRLAFLQLIYLASLYYVRSGFMRISDGHLWYPGGASYSWSSTANALTSSTSALSYDLDISVSIVKPSNGPVDRWYGYPLGRLSTRQYHSLNLSTSSLYYVRSGDIELNAGYLRRTGYYGYEWSLSAVTLSPSTTATAYNLGFTASEIFPSAGPDRRWFSFPLWCPTCNDVTGSPYFHICNFLTS